MSILRQVVLVGLLTTLVGCANPFGGNLDPADQPTGLPEGAPTLPPRPREIRIDNLNPCTLLDREQLRVLNVGGTQSIPADEGIGLSCRWLHSPDEPIESFRIARNTDEGIDVTFGNPQGIQVVSIAGFPAVQTQNIRADPDLQCIVAVDVARGQMLQVTYHYNGGLPVTRELSCEKARLAAELAMQTLIDRNEGG